MAMNKILPTILLWLRLNPGKEPREFKAPKTEEERVEQKVSRCLRHLRGKAELGKLPNDVDDQLTKVFPTWKAQGRRLGHTKPPALALRDTLALLEWCRMHHSNVLVKKTFDPRMCDDEENHAKMWAILRYMKEVAEGPRAEDYATAITFLNDAFGDLWRHRRRDYRPRMVYGEGGMVMMGDEGSYQASYDGYSDDSESDDEDSVTRCQYAKYASTTMNLAMVTTWLRENLGKMPREIKVPKDEGEMVEAKVGRTLRHFRTQAEQGRLPPDVSRQLSDIWPTWRSHYKRCGKPPALALRDAQALVDWCQNHHSNQLVRAHLNHGLCDDPANHARMWAILRYMKDVADGPRADEYAAACAIMDAAYPGQWRYKKRGPNFKLPAASRLKEERDELMAGSASGKRKASDYRGYSEDDDDNYSDDSSQPPSFRQRDMPPYPPYDPHRPPYMLPIPRPPPYNSGPTYIPTGYMAPPPFAGPYPHGPPLGPPPGPFRFEPPTSFSRYPDPHQQQEQPDEGAQGDRDDEAGPATSLEAALQPAAPGERAEILMGATLGLLELAGASSRAKKAKATPVIEETEV